MDKVTGGSDGKESARNAGDQALIPGLGRSFWRRKWQPTPVFLLGEVHGQRSLAGYSSWGRRESDTTEQLIHTHTHTVTHTVMQTTAGGLPTGHNCAVQEVREPPAPHAELKGAVHLFHPREFTVPV